MHNKVYDVLKFIAQIVLPALGTLYFALAGIWGEVLPYGEQVVGTIAAIDTFLGAILGLSSRSYNKHVEYDKRVEFTEIPYGADVDSLGGENNNEDS